MSLFIANTITSIPPVGVLFLLGNGIITSNMRYLMHVLLYLVVTMSTDWIKIFLTPYLDTFPWMKRPADSCDCNLANKGGPSGGASGFPSGHMASTTFLLTPFWLRGSLPTTWFVAAILVVSWTRWYKRCHNIQQILGGIAYGGGAAYLLRSFI